MNLRSNPAGLTTGSALILTGAACFAAALPVAGENPGTPATAPAKPAAAPADPGLVNRWLREASPDFAAWDIGGQVRARFEDFENAGPMAPNLDFQRNGVRNDNDYLWLRARLHAGFNSDWVRVFAEGQTSDSIGDLDPKRPGRDTFELHQAWLDLGNPKELPLALRLGRQELSYGDERLIGASDWSNTGRAFDAARLRYDRPEVRVDAFTGRVVLIDDAKFDQPDAHDWFSGIYASSRTLVPIQETDVYVLSRNATPGAAATPRDIISVGARVKSLPGKLKGWDYFAEVVEQLGSVSQSTVRRDQEAFAAAVGGGYRWANAPASPRLGVEYDFSSGDGDPNDGRSQTLDNLYPTNHRHYGIMDVIGWRNIHDARVSLGLKPAKPLSVTLDYHLFWLADTHDFFYPQGGSGRSASGYSRHPAYDSFVGSELDLDAVWTVNSWLGVRAGYGHFFAGDYVEQSRRALGGAKDADWLYAQLTLSF